MRAKYVMFGFIGLMIAYVLEHNESFLVQPSHPAWKHYEPFKWWLLPHGVAGSCALLLGPLQFSDRLRRRYAKLHRVLGRIYVGGVCLVAPLGVYIQYFEERMDNPRSFTIAAAVDAGLLFATTATALYFILQRKIQQHRQWMTRSYAVALVFVEVRVISGVLNLDDKGIAVAELIVWICLALAIPLADFVLQLQDSGRERSAVTRESAVS